MAERTTVLGYILYSVFVTGFVYPVIVYWAWDTNGWLYRGSGHHSFTVCFFFALY